MDVRLRHQGGREAFCSAPGGAEQSLAAGMIIADSSTISPSATLRFAERVKARGVDYVDAPMTGSKIAAEAGSLIFMVGGDEAVLARLQPLFQAMGKQVFHMGETSKGQATKLVMNLQIALIYEGFAEALTLAAKLGVDVEKMLPLIQASMVRSGVVDYKAPFILKRDFSPNFPLRLMLKDIRLALDAAKESRVRLPGLEAVEEVYDVAAEEGQAGSGLRGDPHVAGKMGGGGSESEGGIEVECVPVGSRRRASASMRRGDSRWTRRSSRHHTAYFFANARM